jgi:hypothetical protein
LRHKSFVFFLLSFSCFCLFFLSPQKNNKNRNSKKTIAKNERERENGVEMIGRINMWKRHNCKQIKALWENLLEKEVKKTTQAEEPECQFDKHKKAKK